MNRSSNRIQLNEHHDMGCRSESVVRSVTLMLITDICISCARMQVIEQCEVHTEIRFLSLLEDARLVDTV